MVAQANGLPAVQAAATDGMWEGGRKGRCGQAVVSLPWGVLVGSSVA